MSFMMRSDAGWKASEGSLAVPGAENLRVESPAYMAAANEGWKDARG
jgi:hypothetical protein